MIAVDLLDITQLVNGDHIECECMVCHLPYGAVHGPVEWRLTIHFPGPWPHPGDETMLLCTPCFEDWRDNADEVGGIAGNRHPI